MVKTKLQRLGILSFGKFGGIYGLLIGLIAGIFVALASTAVPTTPDGGYLGLVFGFGAILIFPLFYGISGFIGGIIGSFLFNIIAKISGGIELHFIEMDDMPKATKKV